MVETMQNQGYSGVLCKSCRQPIPLPVVVRELPTDEGSADGTHEKARVFNLRCRACDKERPYRRGDITVFEGLPKLRTTLRPVSAMGAKKLARAANG
jgi:hypothetical protein